MLWEVLPHPTSASVVRLFARRGDERHGDFAANAKEIRKFARTHEGFNIYVAPNPTESTIGERHSAKDVTHWSYFLIDMDPVEKEYNAREALDIALLWLGEWQGRDFKRTPPIIINSGRGVQAWIRLEDVVLDDSADPVITSTALNNFQPSVRWSTARRVNGYWLKKLEEKLGTTHGCRIDTSVSDLPRVMRCPGTVNVKTGRRAKFIHASDIVFKGLASLLTVGTPKTSMVDPEPVELKPGQPWQLVFPHLTRMAQTYLTQGQAEPGRHKVMWHTAKKLKEVGVTRAEARRALRHANKLKGEKEKLPPDQVNHALATAYGAPQA